MLSDGEDGSDAGDLVAQQERLTGLVDRFQSSMQALDAFGRMVQALSRDAGMLTSQIQGLGPYRLAGVPTGPYVPPAGKQSFGEMMELKEKELGLRCPGFSKTALTELAGFRPSVRSTINYDVFHFTVSYEAPLMAIDTPHATEENSSLQMSLHWSENFQAHGFSRASWAGSLPVDFSEGACSTNKVSLVKRSDRRMPHNLNPPELQLDREVSTGPYWISLGSANRITSRARRQPLRSRKRFVMNFPFIRHGEVEAKPDA
ncbi:hypothetical protein FRB90_010114 [Tulasnella sp. 427]|nr:hypothetical protein FRB90_010114 [Tulasnella sp. 427]